MLSYTGTGPMALGHVNLSALVKEIGELIESAASGQVAVAFRLAKVIPATQGDSSQLSQVVMNLITNAVESVGESGRSLMDKLKSTEGEARAAIEATIRESERGTSE